MRLPHGSNPSPAQRHGAVRKERELYARLRVPHCSNSRPIPMSASPSAVPDGALSNADGLTEAPVAHAGFWALMIGSIGVVYGDIGTSPLYALRESVVAAT